eukprot:CAMPEP_0182589884 /NCGR_PEP_ID=MMETSP1324-20130603/70488_1 /TAXON_ID=236786 /ORGANISM="Florenciella sp., Strain RCC1587" /LENGTH=47 /DNA_ID= /DNA_START= /DNA_END= /DNA_ORIENTATION=
MPRERAVTEMVVHDDQRASLKALNASPSGAERRTLLGKYTSGGRNTT